jgi:uncharacterized membrane protein YqaE (UPF0057 family)
VCGFLGNKSDGFEDVEPVEQLLYAL